ncbi:hypothetical protein INT47_006813 [Mucor saturninus]|uniref:2-dehydropantoate 2-reductase n=1 Tax=Mucor saturninus TaxID=64648 RepID=A0A8H7VAK5_9FUNG|nr:hypothetical protein INT47_006813 [Mucor saturninus]
MNIHILGTGAVGCHIGSVLRAHQNKVTLLLRSTQHVNDFASRNNTITYRSQGKTSLVSGFESAHLASATDNSPIGSLVVATKAHHTLQALSPVASRLSANSTILLLQNGMGIAEELQAKFWSNGQESPRILVGVNRHAVERMGPYDICHYSGYEDADGLIIGEMPSSSGNVKHEGKSELLETITHIPEFQAKQLPWKDVRVQMLKKLIINSCINPVASVLLTKNKGVLSEGGLNVMHNVCEEAYAVLKDELPGETMESLMELVLRIAESAGENSCSTLQDVRGQRLTEIDYINGYICKLGKERGVQTPVNQTLVNLIHAKEVLYTQ